MEYYSASKRNVLMHITTWIKLKIITMHDKMPSPNESIFYDSIYKMS